MSLIEHVDPGEGGVDSSPALYWLALVALAAAWFVAGLLFVLFPLSGIEIVNVGYLVWIVGILHFIAGINIVDPKDFGGVLVLGTPTIAVSGALVVTPAGIFTLITLTRGTIQIELPDEPEKIFRNEDTETVPPGMKPPIRITFANPPKDDMSVDKSDPLEQRTTNEVSVFVRFKITDARSFWVFYVRIQSLDESRRQLEDMSVGILQEELTQLTPAQAFAQLTRINGVLDNHIRTRTRDWGITVIDARIKLIGLSHKFNTAIQAIAESKASKQAAIITAEGEREKRTLEGQGAANAVKAEIDARTAGMKDMAKDLSVEGKDILGVEAARTIGQSPSTKVILGTKGLEQIVGLGAAVAETITKKKPPESEGEGS